MILRYLRRVRAKMDTQEKTPNGSDTGLPNPPLETGFRAASVPTKRFWLLSIGYVELRPVPRCQKMFVLTFILSVCLGLFLSFVDSSIVATSLYSIGIDFDSSQTVNWVALAYTLAYLGCAVTFSRLSDILGRRNTFLAAYIVFIAFSFGCGFAQNLPQLIAFRALQGIGGSGLLLFPLS